MSDIPSNWGPLLRAHGVRGSQIGDCVSALSVYAWLNQHAPDVHTIWQVARRHVHAAPLFYNQKDIRQLTISDCDEGYGPNDTYLANTCQIRFPLMPEHVPGEVWPNVKTYYEETFTMAGLPLDLYRGMSPAARRPRLSQWFTLDRQPKTIAYFPCAAYGVTQVVTVDGQRVVRSRNASRPWALSLVARLRAEGYKVIQCGHPNDYADCGGGLNADVDARHLSLVEMIRLSLGCDLSIGTDSGAAIALGAYGDGGHPQVTLLTNHYPGHTTNLTAFQPDNPANVSLVGVGSADAVSINSVVEAVKQVTSS